MQREEILKRIAEIDCELEKRRKADKLSCYNSGRKKHKKQIAFHKCKKRNRWIFGGNRSGKTECGAVECIWMLRGIHPYRKNRKDVFGWAVSLSQQVQRDVAQAKILSYLPKSWIADITMLSGRKDSPGSGVFAYGNRKSYKLGEGADYAFLSGKTDFGTPVKKTLKTLEISADGKVDIEVTNGVKTRIFRGVSGKIRTPLRGESFCFTVSGAARVTALNAVAEVVCGI